MEGNKDDVLVIRPDFAKILLLNNHKIIRLEPKKYKNSNQVDWTRCVFYFQNDASIQHDLDELINSKRK